MKLHYIHFLSRTRFFLIAFLGTVGIQCGIVSAQAVRVSLEANLSASVVVDGQPSPANDEATIDLVEGSVFEQVMGSSGGANAIGSINTDATLLDGNVGQYVLSGALNTSTIVGDFEPRTTQELMLYITLEQAAEVNAFGTVMAGSSDHVEVDFNAFGFIGNTGGGIPQENFNGNGVLQPGQYTFLLNGRSGPSLMGETTAPGNVSYSFTFDFDLLSTTQIWSNASGGEYSVASNWQDNVAPRETDEVRVDLGGTYDIRLSQNVVNDRFVVGGGSSTANPTLDFNTHSMTSRQVIVDQNGQLNLDGTADGSRLRTEFINVDPNGQLSGNAWLQPRNATPLNLNNEGILRLGDQYNDTPQRLEFVGSSEGPEPGEFDAHLVVRGNYEQSTTGKLAATLTLAKAVNQGRDSTISNLPQLATDLWVTGNTVLDGKLHLDLSPGYVPQHGDSFSILKGGNISGFLELDSPPVGFNDLPLKAVVTDKGVQAVVPQRVVLAFNHDLPYGWQPVSVFDQVLAFIDPDSAASTPAFGIASPDQVGAFETYIESLLQAAEAHFSASGIEAVEFEIGSPRDDAINIYFIDQVNSPSSNLLGQAMTEIDRFNLDAHGDVVVVVNSFDLANPSAVELDAETIAHEVGHVLGLRHVDPAGSDAIMDYDSELDEFEQFIDEVNPIREAPEANGRLFPDTHNPVYHLRRYVDGVPHEDLVAMGTMPGTWDLPGPIFEELDASFRLRLGGMANEDTALFDVIVYSSPTEPGEMLSVLATFDEITLAELAEQSFNISLNEALGLVAASTSGGMHDLLLTSGNPFEKDSLAIYPGLGDSLATIRLRTDNAQGFVDFAELFIDVRAVPEPTAIVLILLGGSMTFISRRCTVVAC